MTTSRKQEANRRRGASGQEATGRQEAEVARQEAGGARQEDERRRRQRDNQLANKGQTGGDGASIVSGFVERTRGGSSGATRGVMTSRGTRGEREERCQQTRGDGVLKAGGTSIL